MWEGFTENLGRIWRTNESWMLSFSKHSPKFKNTAQSLSPSSENMNFLSLPRERARASHMVDARLPRVEGQKRESESRESSVAEKNGETP